MNLMYRMRAIAVLLALSGCGGSAPSSGPAPDPGVARDLELLRNATRPFQNLDAAVDAGYPREVADCLIHEHHGAMGFHHVNRGYLTARPTVDKPQILLYERLKDGGYRLNGVEFIVPYRLWPRDSIAPVLFGRNLKHEDNLQFWFVHVWAWSDNADGIFADFNPAVNCPENNRKVFTPFERPGAD